MGVKGINSDLATAIRTAVILLITWGIALFVHHLGEVKSIPRNAWLFLILSGGATGLSWLFYFKGGEAGVCAMWGGGGGGVLWVGELKALRAGEVSRVAPMDKRRVVRPICLSVLLLKEPVTPRVILGALFITCGSIIMLVK